MKREKPRQYCKQWPTRSSPLLLGVAICLIAVAGTGLAQTERPTVAVSFDMSQSPFAGMSAADRDDIAQAVVDKLATSATRRWGFLDWVPAGNGSVTADAAWTIKIEVEVKTITVNGVEFPAETVYLNHYADTDGQAVRLHQSDEAQRLYDMGAPRPLQDPQGLKEDLLKKLGEQLDQLLNGRQVEQALFKVQLSDQLMFDENNEHIIVPFRLSDLRAEQEVQFKVRLVPVQAVRDDFELEEDGAVDEGEHEGYIIARIIDWSVRSIDVSTPEDWVPELPALMSSFDAAHVFLQDYSPSLSGAVNTDDGVVLDPEQ